MNPSSPCLAVLSFCFVRHLVSRTLRITKTWFVLAKPTHGKVVDYSLPLEFNFFTFLAAMSPNCSMRNSDARVGLTVKI